MIQNIYKMDEKAKVLLLSLSQTKLSKINDIIESNFNEREKKWCIIFSPSQQFFHHF